MQMTADEPAVLKSLTQAREQPAGKACQVLQIFLSSVEKARFPSAPPFLSIVSGISRAVSTSPAAPMQARPRNATLLPSRSLIHPPSVVLSEAPIPIPLPTMPCPTFKRPEPHALPSS